MDVTRTQRNRSLVALVAPGSHASGVGRVSTHRFIVALLAVCFACSHRSVMAQEEGDSSDDASRLAAAFESTQDEVTLESLTHVVDVCEEVLAASPAEADAKYAKQLCSWALVERCQFQLEAEVSREEIVSAVDRALELQPDSAKAIELKGWLAAVEGDLDAALLCFDQAIEIEPKSTRARFNRAEIKYQAAEYVLAIHDYTQVIIVNPRDAQAYTGRGHAYFQLGKFQEALSDYQKVVLLTDSCHESLRHRGDVYSAVGLWSKALKDYQLASAREGDRCVAKLRLAWLLATCPDRTIANPSTAVDLCRDAIEELGPDHWLASHTLATCLASNGDLEAAQKELGRWNERLEGKELDLLEKTQELVARRIEAAESPDKDNAEAADGDSGTEEQPKETDSAETQKSSEEQTILQGPIRR